MANKLFLSKQSFLLQFLNYCDASEADSFGPPSRLNRTLVEPRDGAFILTALALQTLWNTKNKVFCLTSFGFSGTPYTGTQQNRSITCIVSQLQPGVVSQIVEAYARRERNNANNAWLAAAVRKTSYFPFFKALSDLTRVTWTLLPWSKRTNICSTGCHAHKYLENNGSQSPKASYRDPRQRQFLNSNFFSTFICLTKYGDQFT
jgi:hypothetical protein